MTTEYIQELHHELLEKLSGALDDVSNNESNDSNDLKLVRGFLDTIAQQGAVVSVPEERAYLRTLIRYWSSFIYQHTRSFPVIELIPFSAVESSQVGLNDSNAAMGTSLSGKEIMKPQRWFCFLPGTKITLGDRSCINIENVKKGDLLLSFNPKTGEFTTDVCEAVLTAETKEYLTINDYIHVTPSHLFYVNSKWIRAEELAVGDLLFSETGQLVQITSIKLTIDTLQVVHNLRLESNRGFFAEQVLVQDHQGKQRAPVNRQSVYTTPTKQTEAKETITLEELKRRLNQAQPVVISSSFIAGRRVGDLSRLNQAQPVVISSSGHISVPTTSTDDAEATVLPPVSVNQQRAAEEEQRVTFFAEIDKKQLAFLDEAAKRIIEVVTVLLGVLFAIIVFGNDFPPPYLTGNLPAKLLSSSVLVCYMGALLTSLWVLKPRTYTQHRHNVSETGNVLQNMIDDKLRPLQVAGIMFGLGSLLLTVLIGWVIWLM